MNAGTRELRKVDISGTCSLRRIILPRDYKFVRAHKLIPSPPVPFGVAPTYNQRRLGLTKRLCRLREGLLTGHTSRIYVVTPQFASLNRVIFQALLGGRRANRSLRHANYANEGYYEVYN
ncbi:hypothetical protein PUN28_008552 [Cardiocondyla obscurior]|uniref:Uncharacterized protein n=1 Tax=Cardiocondyla obscurior TaxID=286306 RepID=A0AAW2G341_9HYME